MASKPTLSAFHKHKLLPRYLVDVSKRDQTNTVFGQTFASPFGISPTGGAGLFRCRADLMLAEAARDANIPYIMSGASNDTIETAAKIAPKNALVSALCGARSCGQRRSDPRTADAGLGVAGIDRRHAGRLKARAQYPQRLCQYSRRAVSGAEPQALDPRRSADPSRLDCRISASRRRHADAAATGSPTRPPEPMPRRSTTSQLAAPFNAQTWRDLERYRQLFPRTWSSRAS